MQVDRQRKRGINHYDNTKPDQTNVSNDIHNMELYAHLAEGIETRASSVGKTVANVAQNYWSDFV
jgi:hypothetical protein